VVNHAILGAGGLGGFIGGALARAGWPVMLIVRADARAQQPDTLNVSSKVLGDFETPVRVSVELDQPVDAIWITVKATQLEAALQAVPPERVGDALIVPLLNGIDHVAFLRARYPAEQVIAGTIRIEAERVAPGIIRQLSPFADMRLAASPEQAPRVHELAAEVQEAGLTSEVVGDEASLLWGKLAFLAPLALTTTAKGAPLGAVRDDPVWRKRLEASLSEACAVGAAEGARLNGAALLTLVRGAPEGMRTSMQKDVAAGRPPELDAIGGAIVRRGRAHGIETPVIEELVQMIGDGGGQT
jgi:2-dehydropantoate 2-reductase